MNTPPAALRTKLAKAFAPVSLMILAVDPARVISASLVTILALVNSSRRARIELPFEAVVLQLIVGREGRAGVTKERPQISPAFVVGRGRHVARVALRVARVG